ncbi:hypothetical protein [Magnetospirillum sp. 64-120]|uniref:hypothetical protein n=1 Tax=Magnetospirillum sp. 64-120 TaxID=1895778 RepID=UPI000925BE73|nr:hypothetical protein [Magnetospirillum sp. 64-120]OJX79297.1 MAG: hypothetical protein BGO92_12440 [Magnetospirillum sp. 64-120]
MPNKAMLSRLMAALPHEGEVRYHADQMSMLVTRHDQPYTLISVIVKTPGHAGWVTAELDAGEVTLHHPRNLELVDKALDAFLA